MFSLILFFLFLYQWPRVELTFLNVKLSHTCDTIYRISLPGTITDRYHRKHRCESETSFFFLLSSLLPPSSFFSFLMLFFSLFLPPFLSFVYTVCKLFEFLFCFWRFSHTLFLLHFLTVSIHYNLTRKNGLRMYI